MIIPFVIATLATGCIVMFRHNRQMFFSLVDSGKIIENQEKIIELQDLQLTRLREGPQQ